ncbi:MAG: hypothetical protein HYZ75_02700 [Elusimicrobia bacterium]|nr:hypothetical protein [Elusimicrobiota bacterium]
MPARVALLLLLSAVLRAAEFSLPGVDFGALRRQAAAAPAVPGAPQAAKQQALVVITPTNLTLSAASDWADVPEGMRQALVTVRAAEGAAVDLREVTLEVAEVRNGGDYAPGEGTLALSRNDGTEWAYTPFTEHKNEKRPRTISVVIVPKLAGRPAGEPVTLEVRPFFLHVTGFHSHGPRARAHPPNSDDYTLAWRYAKWKYDVDTGDSTTIRYDPALTTMGATNPGAFNVGRNVRLGPTAFLSENHAASVLGHENVHAGQSLYTLLSSARAEPPAYQWEIDNAAALGTGDRYVTECRGYQAYYRGEGPRPD